MFKNTAVSFLVVFLAGGYFPESDAGKADYSYELTALDWSVHRVRLKNAKDVGLVSATLQYGDIKVELLGRGG